MRKEGSNGVERRGGKGGGGGEGGGGVSNSSIHHEQFVAGGCNYVIGLGGVKEEAEAAGAVKLPPDVASSHARNLISLSLGRGHGGTEKPANKEQRV